MNVVSFVLIITGYYISGELVSPHYVNIFSGVSRSFVAKAIRGVLTGKRYVPLVYVVFFPRVHHFIIKLIRA